MKRSHNTVAGVMPLDHLRRKPADAAQISRTDFMRRALLAAIVVLATGVLLVSSQPALAQFSQQGSKLVGTGAVGAAQQGFSVVVSADGNTAIMGGQSRAR